MQGIEADLWLMVAVTFVVGFIAMLTLVYKKAYMLTGSAVRIQGTMMIVSLAVLMMGMTLACWFFLAVVSPDFIISPLDLSQFWGGALTVGGMVFIVSLTTGFIALHVYRGGA